MRTLLTVALMLACAAVAGHFLTPAEKVDPELQAAMELGTVLPEHCIRQDTTGWHFVCP